MRLIQRHGPVRMVAPLMPALMIASLLVGATALCLAMQGAGDPTILKPQAGLKGRPVTFPRGDVLLFEFLQKFANFSGQTVCHSGGEPPQATITLRRALDSIDIQTARRVLQDNGLELSQELYRDKTVYWVRRPLAAPTGKGRIIRRSEPGGELSTPKGTEPGSTTGRIPAEDRTSSIRMYRVEQGRGPKFLVTFETESEKEAKDAVLLLRARRNFR